VTTVALERTTAEAGRSLPGKGLKWRVVEVTTTKVLHDAICINMSFYSPEVSIHLSTTITYA
jgi:hypothetical protein